MSPNLFYDLVHDVFDDCDDARANTKRWRVVCVDETVLNESQDVHVQQTEKLIDLPGTHQEERRAVLTDSRMQTLPYVLQPNSYVQSEHTLHWQLVTQVALAYGAKQDPSKNIKKDRANR